MSSCCSKFRNALGPQNGPYKNAHVTEAQFMNKNTNEMHVKLSPMKLMKTGNSTRGEKGATKLVGTSLQKTFPQNKVLVQRSSLHSKGGPNDKTQRRFASRLAQRGVHRKGKPTAASPSPSSSDFPCDRCQKARLFCNTITWPKGATKSATSLQHNTTNV